jgi:hypothetical protein
LGDQITRNLYFDKTTPAYCLPTYSLPIYLLPSTLLLPTNLLHTYLISTYYLRPTYSPLNTQCIHHHMHNTPPLKSPPFNPSMYYCATLLYCTTVLLYCTYSPTVRTTLLYTGAAVSANQPAQPAHPLHRLAPAALPPPTNHGHARSIAGHSAPDIRRSEGEAGPSAKPVLQALGVGRAGPPVL